MVWLFAEEEEEREIYMVCTAMGRTDMYRYRSVQGNGLHWRVPVQGNVQAGRTLCTASSTIHHPPSIVHLHTYGGRVGRPAHPSTWMSNRRAKPASEPP